jgi:Fe-S-cluster containining protein
MTPDQRKQAWDHLQALYRAAAYASRPYCVQCGTCCSNAGPTLYAGDQALLQDGTVTPAQLHTVRSGEMVHSHWTGQLELLEREIVMITRGPDGCVFLDARTRRCSIHDRVPAQCRAQKCWDTRDADKLMGWPGLSRLELIEETDPVAAVVAEHEINCAIVKLRERLAEAAAGDEAALEAAVELIRADRRYRARIVDEEHATEDALPFLLGRPLETMTRQMGYEVGGGWEGDVVLRKRRG